MGCGPFSLKYDYQQYFKEAIMSLNLNSLDVNDLIHQMKKFTNEDNDNQIILNDKYKSFINDDIIIKYNNVENNNKIYPNVKKFLETYFKNLYENLNYGVKEIFLLFIILINKSFSIDEKKAIQQYLNKIINVQDNNELTIKAIANEIAYNLITLPSEVLYYLAEEEGFKNSAKSLIENELNKQKIINFVDKVYLKSNHMVNEDSYFNILLKYNLDELIDEFNRI